MTNAEHDRWSEDLAAYMLGALEPEEAAELERHAAGCERCQGEMRWLAPAVQALPEAVRRLEPPAELRDRLLTEVRADAGAAGAQASSAEGGVGHRMGAWLRDLGSGPMGLRPVVGFAAALLVVAAVAGYAIGGGISGGSSESESASPLVARENGIVAKMVPEGDSGTLHLADVRHLPPDKVLEAWIQRDGRVAPVRSLFVPDGSGNASTALPQLRGAEAVLVTAEPRGGSPQPTSEPIVTIPIPG